MGQSLVNTVRGAIEKQGLLRAGERVGVAVSGGADSVALLLLLLELRKQLGVVLSVAHFNHKLRGKDSEADEKFAARLAAGYGLAFHSAHADVAAKAKRNKTNLEDTARRARYEFFATLVQGGHLDKVAVAHTADDQAETVLAHILRGTGLAGLGGIHPEVGHVVRPLLGVRRPELRAYLRSKKQTWREDSTNRDTTRTRARIRRKLIPILVRQFQSAVVEHLAALAEFAREDEALLEALAKERAEGSIQRKTGSVHILVRDLLACKKTGDLAAGSAEEKNRAISRRMVRRIVGELKPREGQLNAEHVHSIVELAESGENGKYLQLPGGLQVRREHDALIFRAASSVAEPKHKPLQFERAINFNAMEAVVSVRELGCVFRFRVIDWPAKRGDTIEKGFVLDRDALQSPLVLRNWRPGDKLRPCGHRSEHKLKRLLSKKRMSRWEREGWPVLTSRGVLVWARGFAVATEFAAGEKTRAGIVISEEAIS
ncbi:MAG TPA: tRNA lysidine(34) synthetase TilS [Candidatus Acidoferrum sp.]|nr:tRNA lysidine(34) synthetase TilS [Candidatus Acidoferrum sp.]